MIEKNALDWLDLGEGLEKLDIYKGNKLIFLNKFFKTLLSENQFNLYFYLLLQSIFYIQLCCLALPGDNNTYFLDDYLIYIIHYLLKIFLPHTSISSYNVLKLTIIFISMLLLILLVGFFIVILNMNKDKKNKFVKLIISIINILLQIIMNYLIGPIIGACLKSFYCKSGKNEFMEFICENERNNFIFIILSIINILFYLCITIIFSIFFNEIGKIGEFTPKTQLDTNFELYSLLLKILIFILYDVFFFFIEKKKIFRIVYHSILFITCLTFALYIYKNIFFYDEIMNCVIHLGSFLSSWFCLIILIRDIFDLNKLSIFVLFGWIIIISANMKLIQVSSNKIILKTNIFQLNKLKDLEMLINSILKLIHSPNSSNKTVIYGFYYQFKEFLTSNNELKEKYDSLTNSKFLKDMYNDSLVLNGYYIIYIIYEYYLTGDKLNNNLLNIHFCYFLINYLKNTVSAIYQCSKIKSGSFKIFYYKYILAENIKDYLVEITESNNKKLSPKNVQFSTVILYYLYQNLLKIKITEITEVYINYYEYFKNFTFGSKSSLGFLKEGEKIIKMRKDIKGIWDKILILNPFCPEIRKEYLYYIKEILNDDYFLEKEQKNHNYLKNIILPQKNSFYYRTFNSLNSAVLLSEFYENNKILYTTPNFKRIIFLQKDTNDLTINSLLPNVVAKFHNSLINESLFYSNLAQTFHDQKSVLLKTKNNTLLNMKIYVKELPNLSYGLIFIIHMEKILSNDFIILLNKELKINGYSDEQNAIKKESFDNFGLIQNFNECHICTIIPEIFLSLTCDNLIENEYNDLTKEIKLKNAFIYQRGNLYKYNATSPSKSIIDKVNDIINDIKRNKSFKEDVIKQIKEKEKNNAKDEVTKTMADATLIFNQEKSLSKKYIDLVSEIEQTALKTVKVEYEIAERTFLNNKHKYYILTIRKDIYNYDYDTEENNDVDVGNNNTNMNLLKKTLIETNLEFRQMLEKQININLGKYKSNNIAEKKEENNNLEKSENEKIKQKENVNENKMLKMKIDAINEIKEKILGNNFKTSYNKIMLYLSIFTALMLYIFLIYNNSNGLKNLDKVSNYLNLNLYYNETRIHVSHMYIIFINFIFIKTKFLKPFTYNNISCIDIYKSNFKNSIDNIFDLTKNIMDFDKDYYEILSKYFEINIKNPYTSYQTINLTNFQLIKMIIVNSLKFNYNIDNFLAENEDRKLFYSLNNNIDKHCKYYLFYEFNGIESNEIKIKVSKRFNNIPFSLIIICVIIVIVLLLYSYIIYSLNYYEKFFLIKIMNLDSKEFEEYLRHFEELKYKLKNEEDNDPHKTFDNDETHDISDDNIIHENKKEQNNLAEKNNNKQNKVETLNGDKEKIDDKEKNENNDNTENDLSKSEEERRKNEISKRKAKIKKREKQKKIKLLEQKKIKIKKMLEIIIAKNLINSIKIILSVLVGITYYIIHSVYSNSKINSFTNFNIIIESIETVFTNSFIIYLNFKIEILNFVDYYHRNEEQIKNNTMKNYTLSIITNKNYTSPDFNNYIMEILNDFEEYEGNNTEAIIYKLYNNDACQILYNLNNSNYNNCRLFWSGVISKGLEQAIIEMGSQFSILISLFSLVNSGEESIEKLLEDNIWKNYDYFMMTYLYNSFEKSHYYLNNLRLRYLEQNKKVFEKIFFSYLIVNFIIALIFIYFAYSVIAFFITFLNFIAIIPVKILIENKDINKEIINISKKLIH